MQLAPAGDRAILVELGEVSAAELHAANQAVRSLPRVLRSTPGHSSLYVVFDGTPDAEGLVRTIRNAGHSASSADSGTRLVRVAFDGEDLEEFLVHAGVERQEFLDRVNNLTLTARYLGFRSGFAYLDGWPDAWSMPRRSTSRPVRRGSFAIAGSVAAFYPLDTPGGWNVLGHTDADLEDAIAPGDRLTISVSIEPLPLPPQRDRRSTPPPELFETFSAPLAVWTDRPFDELAAALANRAVGNDPRSALLECPMAGPKVRFARDATVAWCTPTLEVSVASVRAGEERSPGRVTGGLRGYLAVGAREAKSFAGGRIDRDDRLLIRARSGPHDLGWKSFACEVTPQLDRVGIRLRPLQPLNVDIPADLRSVGMQCGTVQLHPDGSLLAMGPDHPVTGGYLQPMTVLSSETWKLAQLMPGERVRFEIE